MKKIESTAVLFVLACLLLSCRTIRPENNSVNVSLSVYGGGETEAAVQAHKAPADGERIMGAGSLTKSQMVDFLFYKNGSLDRRLAESLIDTYIAEAAFEGVNHDIAFAQMCFHTKYLSFAGTFVRPETYNYCGLVSARNSGIPHVFDERQTGVRAHIQHLKAYATFEPPKRAVVDPRYGILKARGGLGTAQTLRELSGKWAGYDYADSVRDVLRAVFARQELSAAPRASYVSAPF